MQMLDLVLHGLAQLLVQRPQRLVHQDQLGLEHQRPGQRHPLLLAARHLRRAAVRERPELHHVERPRHPRRDVGLRDAANLERERHILPDGHVGEQGVVLEHHADVAPIGRHLVDRLAG